MNLISWLTNYIYLYFARQIFLISSRTIAVVMFARGLQVGFASSNVIGYRKKGHATKERISPWSYNPANVPYSLGSSWSYRARSYNPANVWVVEILFDKQPCYFSWFVTLKFFSSRLTMSSLQPAFSSLLSLRDQRISRLILCVSLLSRTLHALFSMEDWSHVLWFQSLPVSTFLAIWLPISPLLAWVIIIIWLELSSSVSGKSLELSISVSGRSLRGLWEISERSALA